MKQPTKQQKQYLGPIKKQKRVVNKTTYIQNAIKGKSFLKQLDEDLEEDISLEDFVSDIGDEE